MASQQYSFQEYNLESRVPQELKLNGGDMDVPIIDSRSSGIQFTPQGPRTISMTGANGGATINFRLTSPYFFDLASLRLNCTVACSDLSGIVMLENGHSMFNNVKTIVSGIEVDNITFPATLANAIVKLNANSDWYLTQGIANGYYLEANAMSSGDFVNASPFTADMSGTISNMGAELKGAYNNGSVDLSIDLSWLGICSQQTYYDARHLGALEFQFVLNSPNQMCIVDRTTTVGLTLSNIELRCDIVQPSAIYLSALDKYLSSPDNIMAIPIDTFTTLQTRLDAGAGPSQLSFASAKRFMKQIITCQVDPLQGTAVGALRYSRFPCWGLKSQQLQINGVYYPTLKPSMPIDLYTYSLSSLNEWGNSRPGASLYTPGTFGALNNTTPARYADGTANAATFPDMIWAGYASKASGSIFTGTKANTCIVVHNLEQQSQDWTSNLLQGTNTSATGATFTIYQERRGTANAVVPTGGGILMALCRYAGILQLKNGAVTFLSS